MSKLSTTDT